jgi:hypothetical protein
LGANVSWFSKAIEYPIKDMHIVHVFAPAWKGSNPPPYLSIRNDELFNDPARWINLKGMEHRARTEERETERLRKVEPTPIGRKRSVRAANKCYESYCLLRGKLYKQPPEQDVRWTAQCISKRRRQERKGDFTPDGFFDELLYRLYAKNLDIFGDKAARELYVFDIGYASRINLKYTLTYTRDGTDSDRTGEVRLRLYAILKELAYPPLADFNYTFFSPIIALAAVLSPVYNDENGVPRAAAIPEVLDLSLDLDDARFEDQRREGPLLLDEFIVGQAQRGLEQLSGVDWSSLMRPPLTQFSVFVIGLNDHEVPQGFLRDPAARLVKATDAAPDCQSHWRTQFLHYIARVCALSFQITAEPHGLWERNPQPLRCIQEFAALKLSKFAKTYLPTRSVVSVRSNMLEVAAPGRKVLVQSLNADQIDDIKKRRSKTNGDFLIDWNYKRRDVLDSVARNALLCSLVTSQEALLARFHAVISESGDIADVKADLKEFDNFYDVDLFDLPNSAFYQDAFNDLKHVLDLDRQYEMLHKKLEITVSNIHADNLKWAIVAFLFAGFMAITSINDVVKLIIVTIFSSVAISLVIVRPGWSQLKLLCKKIGRWIRFAPALIGELRRRKYLENG